MLRSSAGSEQRSQGRVSLTTSWCSKTSAPQLEPSHRPLALYLGFPQPPLPGVPAPSSSPARLWGRESRSSCSRPTKGSR